MKIKKWAMTFLFLSLTQLIFLSRVAATELTVIDPAGLIRAYADCNKWPVIIIHVPTLAADAKIVLKNVDGTLPDREGVRTGDAARRSFDDVQQGVWQIVGAPAEDVAEVRIECREKKARD